MRVELRRVFFPGLTDVRDSNNVFTLATRKIARELEARVPGATNIPEEPQLPS